MSDDLRPPTSNWAVFLQLWRSTRLRSAARGKRQGELLQNRSGAKTNHLGNLATFLMIAFSALVHGLLGWTMIDSLKTGQIVVVESRGLIVVSDYAAEKLEKIREMEEGVDDPSTEEEFLNEGNSLARSESYERRQRTGRSLEEEREAIVSHFKLHGRDGFVTKDKVLSDLLADPGDSPGVVWVLPTIILFWWFAMLVSQGEGLEIDIQKRRHPIWEWLFSHPVRPLAAFSAEMLSPLLANPIYFTAPVFWFMVFREFQPFGLAVFGSLLIGLPLATTASCANKAIEIAAMLRLPERSRGAVLGLISWIGYVAMMLPLFTMKLQQAKTGLVEAVEPLASIPVFTWPAQFTIISLARDQWWGTVFVSWVASASLLGCAGILAWRGVALGLQGQGSGTPTVGNPKRGFLVSKRFSNPLFRKELLWLWRDKAAVIQVVLIPLTIGLLQAFNLQGLASAAGSQWNLLCGFAILCGTYFLLVLGPRSLSSEGGAIWIALTWPQGLEDLLKAKALLWWRFSTAIVGVALVGGMFLFPKDWWRIALVGVGWWFFGRALAEKSVSLVTAPSSGGETEKPPMKRQLAAMLGTFAFGAGVITKNWHLAFLGVVFSSLTAAAMWQNLRARLPHLFDPWTEKIPPAPTLLHGMIGIAILVETVAISVAVATAAGGPENVWLTQTICYAVGSFLVFAGMSTFLEGRNVTQEEIWNWIQNDSVPRLWKAIPAAIAGGAILGGGALLYLALLPWLPFLQDYMERLSEISSHYTDSIIWQIVLMVGLAPLAEEFLFRGILYRALDREWGGWKAIVGSSSYFAIYHPPISWVPVFLLGFACAFLFKKTGRLWTCVFLHAAYNLTVILGSQ